MGHPVSCKNAVPKRIFSQFNKIWNQGDFENPDFPTLVNCEKFISKTFAYIHKTQFSIFFMNQDKMRGSARATFKNYKISLWIGKKTWKVSQSRHSKISILKLWMNKKKFCPNLRFTVENKIGDLYKTNSHFKLNIMNEIFHSMFYPNR